MLIVYFYRLGELKRILYFRVGLKKLKRAFGVLKSREEWLQRFHTLNTIKKRRAVPSLTSHLLKIKSCQLYFLFDYRVLQQPWMPHALSLEL